VALTNRGRSATPTGPVFASDRHIRPGLSAQAAAVRVDDPMVGRLLANRPAGLFDDYQRGVFERLLDERFVVHRQQTPPGGTRRMCLAEPKL
jgi:hypothetical protein